MNKIYTKDARLKYTVQKYNALNRRNIGWEFTFEEWLQVWLNSCHWNNRGRETGQYVMARFNDSGPYSKDNVEIITTADNVKAATNRAKTSYNKVQSIMAEIRS